MKRLDHYWYSQNPVAWLLLPLSWLFAAVSALRRALYRARLLRVESLPVPVIVVGNIAVGGTGKTPLLIALCDLLKSRGYSPGIISRGYGARRESELLLNESSSPSEAGDEPLLIARHTFCPVAVGQNRVAAAKLLLEYHDCDIVLSDDGLQHYRLRRDIEIAVVDAKRMHGNGYYLPAGPLREPVSRLDSVDFVVIHGSDDAEYEFALEIATAVNLESRQRVDLVTLAHERVHAVAGIGNPQRFFDQLEAFGIEPVTHAFPDHHVYTRDELCFGDELPVFMTEKDAVKCEHLGLDNLWYVPAKARLSPALIADFLNRVQRVVYTREHPTR